MLLNLGEKMDTLNQAAAFAGTKSFQALSDSGITELIGKLHFGIELGSLADWPSNAHWPSLFVTLPVMDPAKAGKIVDALLHGDEEASWAANGEGRDPLFFEAVGRKFRRDHAYHRPVRSDLNRSG